MPDRKKVLDDLQDAVNDDWLWRHADYYALTMERAIDLLKEQEPKTGKWILDDDDANSWECSECGGLLMINDGTPHENDWHFCPYCGAKLDKQEMKWE